MNVLKSFYDENNVFNNELELYFKDCDTNEKAKISTILAFACDTAVKAYYIIGVSHERMMNEKQVLLLAKYHVRFLKVPKAGEKINIQTWEYGVKSGLILRNFEIFDSNNQVCYQISSTWVAVNPDTKMIIRGDRFKLKVIDKIERPIDCEPFTRISLNTKDLKYIGTRIIYKSDLDANNHVNNAKYGDIATDYLPDALSSKELKDFYISYDKEIKLGDKLDIFAYDDLVENSYYIVGKVEDSIHFHTKFVY